MGRHIVKNWSPREVISFLKKNGFSEIKLNKGDHCGLFNNVTKAYTEVDKGRDAFTKREMLGFWKDEKDDVYQKFYNNKCKQNPPKEK